MSDWHIIAAIFVLGAASYGMRVGGFLLAGVVSERGEISRLLRLAPGNLFIAFAAAGCLAGGWSSAAGAIAGLATMVFTKKEWAALAAGFAVAATASAIQG